MHLPRSKHSNKMLLLTIQRDIFQLETPLFTKADRKIQHMWTSRAWLYRCRLVINTLVICWLLFMIQKISSSEPSMVSQWQSITRWAEVLWIIPTPLAAIFWIGWLLFAQAACSDPIAVKVPPIVTSRNDVSQSRPVRLVLRFVTRGDNVDVLQASIQSVYNAFARYPTSHGPYRVEVISEYPINLAGITQGETFVYVVPKKYVTPKQSRFKARALTYLQEQSHPQLEDWHIYLDEESKIDDVFIAGVYQFILRSEQNMRRPKQCHKGYIGQGTIIYQGGHWFFRMADAIRTSDDLGRFHLQYRLGVPIFGMHGSFVVVRGIDETHLSFDVGPCNSIAEDTAWALRAWVKGFRFAWIDGYLYEQPPQKVKDFIKQRARWLIGIRLVLRDKTLPLPYKWCLGIFTCYWHLSPLLVLVAIMALFPRTDEFLWVQIPANFTWTVFFLAYAQGADIQMRRAIQFFSGKRPPFLRALQICILSYILALGIFWYSLLESLSIFYAIIRPQQGFFIIRKPVLQRRKQEATL